MKKDKFLFTTQKDYLQESFRAFNAFRYFYTAFDHINRNKPLFLYQIEKSFPQLLLGLIFNITLFVTYFHNLIISVIIP